MAGGVCLMPSLMEDRIRDHIVRCVAEQDSLDLFRQWFVPVSWDIEKTADVDAIALAYRVDGLLAEASSAAWTDEQLRHELANSIRPLVQLPMIQIEKPATADILDASGTTASVVVVVRVGEWRGQIANSSNNSVPVHIVPAGGSVSPTPLRVRSANSSLPLALVA
jgi:hypothetical protein